MRAETSGIADQAFRVLLPVLVIYWVVNQFQSQLNQLFNIVIIIVFVGVLSVLVFRNDSVGSGFGGDRRILYAAITMTLLARVVPYISNRIPIGYDAGIYKFLFEHPFAEQWEFDLYPGLFVRLMSLLSNWFGAQFLLVPLFVILSGLGLFAIYRLTQKVFGESSAILAALFFSVSITQYHVFSMNLYKNAIGIILLCAAVPQIENTRKLNWKLILIGGLIGGFHRPALLVFGLTYVLVHLFRACELSIKDLVTPVLNVVAVIALVLLFNFDRIDSYLLSGFFATLNSFSLAEAPGGEFFSPYQYAVFAAPFIALSIPGLYFSWRKSLSLTIAAVVLLVFVLFQLFFYKRLIVYLDLFVIIFAARGFEELIARRTQMGNLVLGASVLTAAAGLFLTQVFTAAPQIRAAEFQDILDMNNDLETDATVMLTDSTYGPFFKGWLDREIVAPGMFNNDEMSYEDWLQFWQGVDRPYYLSLYSRPIYVHTGEQQPPIAAFDAECFPAFPYRISLLYKFTC